VFIYNGFQRRKPGEAISGFTPVDGLAEDRNETTRVQSAWPSNRLLRLQITVDRQDDDVTIVATDPRGVVTRYSGALSRLKIDDPDFSFHDDILPDFGVGTTLGSMKILSFVLEERTEPSP